MIFLMQYLDKFIPTKPLYKKMEEVKHANYGGVKWFVKRRIWILTWYYNIENYGFKFKLTLVPEARLRKWEK